MTGATPGHEWLLDVTRLRRARLRADITQSDMAARMGVHQSTVCAWEKGTNAIGVAKLGEWARITGKSPNWFYGDEQGR